VGGRRSSRRRASMTAAREYRQVTLNLSKKIVTVPFALMARCSLSRMLKLLPGPWPIMSKRLMNVSWNVTKLLLNWSCVTPVPSYLAPVVSPVPLTPYGWKCSFAKKLLSLAVSEITACPWPLRSTTSPVPSSAHGVNTERLNGVLVLDHDVRSCDRDAREGPHEADSDQNKEMSA
jgi:hypothetical protein